MAIRQSAVVHQMQALYGGAVIAGLTDAQLLERFSTRRGEDAEAAFAGVVARHGPMVLGVCRGLLRNPHDAEDAFQATFMVLARKAGSLRRPELVGPWLYGVAHRSARQIKTENERRRRREAEAAMLGARLGVDAKTHEFNIARREDFEALHDEIKRLPERYRLAIVLCDLQGLTHEEAARRLGRPVGTVSAQLSRARERLQSRLRRRGLVLPAVGLTIAFSSSKVSAMPPALVSSTIKIAMAVSAGVTVGAVPVSVATLSQGVLKSLFLSKVKALSVVALLGTATVGSVTVLVQNEGRLRAMASRANNPAPKSEAAVQPEKATNVALPKTAMKSASSLKKNELPSNPAKAELEQSAGVWPRLESVKAPVVRGIKIDGSLDDWPVAMPRHPITKMYEGNGPNADGYRTIKNHNFSTSPNLSAAFSVGYDPSEQLVYLAVIVRDDRLVVGHSSHVDTDAVEVYVDGLHSERSIPYSELGDIEQGHTPVHQYIGIPGSGKIYGLPRATNPVLLKGDLTKTKTRMAFTRKGAITTYEWAIQVFDEYPSRPTRLVPGKRIGFDVAVVDKDEAATTPGGFDDPKDDRTLFIYWGPRWTGMKVLDAGSLGEIVLTK